MFSKAIVRKPCRNMIKGITNANFGKPDSVFIEDVTLITIDCAIITRPGETSRQGETKGIRDILQEYYTDIHEIVSPGTVEAGDSEEVASN